ncbi:MAG: IPT/TIG domain-containing protein, partial [Actinomycetota bacterium]
MTVTFSCSDTLSGVATCPAAVVASTDGADQIVSGTAADHAGNNASASTTLDIDKTPPSVTITAPVGTVTGNSMPEVTVQYTDATSGIATGSLAVRVDGSLLTGCTVGPTAAMCPTPALASGTHTVVVSVADVAGNLQTGASSFSLILNGPPTLDPIGNQTALLGRTLTLTITGSDADGDPTTFDISPLPLLAHASFDRSTGVFAFKPSDDQVGAHVLTFSIS